MTHHRTILNSTLRAPLNGPSQSSHVATFEDEYYRSNASSSACSSPSPRPDSDSGSDLEDGSGVLDCLDLQSIVATAPEAQLRAAISKVIGYNYTFRYAVARELRASTNDTVQTPTTPTTHRKSKRRRRSRMRGASKADTVASLQTCLNCGGQFNTPGPSTDECFYHPGELEADVFEFIYKTPEGRDMKVLKNITMWSCCEEDVGSLGCAIAPCHVRS